MSIIDGKELTMQEPDPEVRILGRVIGTASGWDSLDQESMAFYYFDPVEGVDIPASECLGVLFEEGRFVTYDEEGKETWSADIISVLRDVKPREVAMRGE